MTPVELQIVFDPSGAVTGFKQIGDAGDAMGTKIVSASKAAELALNNQVTASSKAAGQVAILTAQWEAEQAAVNKANQALQSQSSTVSSATSAFQGLTSEQTRANVAGRLLEQTFGLQNRALNQVLSRSATLGPILAGAFNIAIFASIVPMIQKIGEGIISITDDLGGYTDAVKKIQQDTVQASQDAFMNPKTLEFTQQHIDQLNEVKKRIEAAQAAQVDNNTVVAAQSTIEGKILQSLGGSLIAKATSAQLSAQDLSNQQKIDALTAHRTGLEKQITDEITAQGNAQNALIGKSGFSLIAQQKSNAFEAIDINNAGDTQGAKATAERAVAEQRADAEILQLRTQLAQETMAINGQIIADNLSGVDQIEQQEANAINNARADLAQRLGLSQTEVEKTAIYQATIAQIHEQTQKRILAYTVQTAADIASIQAQAREASLSGDDLIIAQETAAIAKARAEYEKSPSPEAWDRYLANVTLASAQANAQIAANDKATQDARDMMLSKSLEQEKDAQSATALAMVPPWLRAYSQIEDQENKRLLQVDDNERTLLNKYQGDSDAISQITATAQAQRLQVWAETNQKIDEENQKLTQQFGSEIKSLFDDIQSGNIGKRILSNIEALFAQIVAAWILSLGVMKSAFGGLFGSIIFGPGSMGANVFGGGAGVGTLLGNLFGSGSSPAIAAAAAGSSGGFNLPGLGGEGGLGTAIAGTSAQSTLTSASNALNTGTLEDALFGINGGPSSSPTTSAASTAVKGAATSSLFSAQSLTALGPMGIMLASALGGKAGMIGGAITASTFAVLPKLLSAFGVSGAIAPLILGPLAFLGAGLTGFGLGNTQGGLLGSLAGAGSGALTGFLVGGPIGAAVGGIIGLLGGIFGGMFGGSKRKKEANDYANNTVMPDIQQIVTGFDGFQIDSSSAIQQLEQLRTDSQKQLATLKSQGNDVFKNTVSPAIDAAEKHINDTQNTRNTRSNTLFGPPQFDTGGMFSITGMGNAGLAVLHDGEFVVNSNAAKKNMPTLAAMNAGATASGISIGNLNINPSRLDSAYMRDPNGFQKDLARALTQMQIEGKI